MKEELGEQGQGNCQRYRDLCGGRQRVDCRSLREACISRTNAGNKSKATANAIANFAAVSAVSRANHRFSD
jgi:hypothetical protein